MFTAAIFLVIMSGLLHAVWNLFAKRSLNKVVFLWSIQWVAVFVYLPWALGAVRHHPIPFRGWLFLVITAALHGAYVILLSEAYNIGDLSQVYPLMRGVSPLLVPFIGVFVLGERLSGPGWLGVGSVAAGIWILGNWRCGDTGGNDYGLLHEPHGLRLRSGYPSLRTPRSIRLRYITFRR